MLWKPINEKPVLKCVYEVRNSRGRETEGHAQKELGRLYATYLLGLLVHNSKRYSAETIVEAFIDVQCKASAFLLKFDKRFNAR